MNQKELEEIEQNLKCPQGEKGIAMAFKMNETNISMTLAAIQSLNLKGNEVVLEIGPGNSAHLPEIISQAEDLTYFGLEISETMHDQACIINERFVKSSEAEFHLYDGEVIPFHENMFDKVMTVNTLYFWKNPVLFLNEVYRVLKPNGTFSIVFAQKKFMETLPFIGEEFSLYDDQLFHEIVNKSMLSVDKIEEISEGVKSKLGDFAERVFSVATVFKES